MYPRGFIGFDHGPTMFSVLEHEKKLSYSMLNNPKSVDTVLCDKPISIVISKNYFKFVYQLSS